METEESKKLNDLDCCAIIIAGSGMMTGGRILHHLRNQLHKPEASLVIVGYQSEGSLGRRLVDGAKHVRIYGTEIDVRATVHTINGLSAHADQDDLLDWLEGTGKAAAWLVHGELAGHEVVRRSSGVARPRGDDGRARARVRPRLKGDLDVPSDHDPRRADVARGRYRPAQEPAMSDSVHYTIGWSNPASQLYEVAVTARADGEPIVFSLPAWRPGRYIVQNYAANVQRVRASDERGNPIPAEWIDLDSWRVDPGAASSVTLAYEYYAHTFDAGSSTLTPDVAYFNPVNLLPWVEGRKAAPATLTIGAPADWTVATQLTPVAGEGHTFSARNFDRLVDSPTIVAPGLVVWDYDVDGVPYHLVFRVVQGQLSLGEYTQERILADVARITEEAVAIFGDGAVRRVLAPVPARTLPVRTRRRARVERLVRHPGRHLHEFRRLRRLPLDPGP